VIKIIPGPLMEEFRRAAQERADRPSGRIAALTIIALWFAAGAFAIWAFWPTPAP
jgi:hypothetical protein